MNALLLVTVLCFFALFATALAVARHVRIQAAPKRRTELQPRHSGPHTLADRVPPALTRAKEQRLQSLALQKEPDWRFLVSDERRRSTSTGAASSRVRKPPTGAYENRSDWMYYNQDLGNLNDPYQPSATRSQRRAG